MPALPDLIINKVIGWTPTGNTFRGKLATRYLFLILLAINFIIMSVVWVGFFLVVNYYTNRPLSDGMYLAALETLLCTPFTAYLCRGWFRKRWARKSVLTSDDVYLLIAYGKEVLQKDGKALSWRSIQLNSNPKQSVQLVSHVGTTSRFPCRVREYHVIGGILCAMYQEGGWGVFPKEAWSFFNDYPYAFRAFYSNYR